MKQPSFRNAVRRKSFKYFLTLEGKSHQVCKKAFLQLLNIGIKKLDLIRNQISEGKCRPHKDSRGRHDNRPNKTPNEDLDIIREHIKSFPAETSHYSRNKNESRLYLPPLLSINKMYELYKRQCVDKNIIFVSEI